MMFNPFSALTSKVYGALAVFFLGLALIQTARIEGFLFWDGLYEQLGDARDKVKEYEAAIATATKLAQEKKARIEAENERKAKDAAELEKKLRADYDSRLTRWLQNNRRAANNTNLPETSKAPEGTAGSGSAAVIPEDFALVPIADLELSAQAFAKLKALQAWAREVSSAD
jgi:hypothetical protein